MSAAPRTTLNKRLRRVGWILVLPATVYVFLFGTVPLLASAVMSLFRWNLTQARLPPRFIGLDNFTEMLADPIFQQTARNTLLFMILTVSMQVVFGLSIALLLNQPLRGAKLVAGLTIMPMTIAPAVVAWLFSVLLHESLGPVSFLFRLVGQQSPPWFSDPVWSLPSIALVDTWQWTPFMVLMMLAALKSQPVEVREAALIDGAGPWQRFIYVTLPLLRPVLVVAILLRVIDAFKMFDLVFLLTNGGPGNSSNVLSLYGYKLGVGFLDIGRGSTISLILMSAGLAFSIIFYRLAGRNA